ncbi:MAG: hypothetical protein ABEJ72_10920 [Candidatus Aenigmatarchaeota archaeon]
MSQLDRYRDQLEYLPRKERSAMEEIMFVEEDVENVALSVIQQMNRSKESLKRIGYEV